jgi:hypothetical protein
METTFIIKIFIPSMLKWRMLNQWPSSFLMKVPQILEILYYFQLIKKVWTVSKSFQAKSNQENLNIQPVISTFISHHLDLMYFRGVSTLRINAVKLTTQILNLVLLMIFTPLKFKAFPVARHTPLFSQITEIFRL